ncbi:hypothetical protein EV715DRAFT_292400 [Schizophyllum commune]
MTVTRARVRRLRQWSSTASPCGGQEITASNTFSTVVHHGIIFTPLGYAQTFMQLTSLNEVHYGSPYGADTFAGGDSSRQPSALEREDRGQALPGNRLQVPVLEEQIVLACRRILSAAQMDTSTPSTLNPHPCVHGASSPLQPQLPHLSSLLPVLSECKLATPQRSYDSLPMDNVRSWSSN